MTGRLARLFGRYAARHLRLSAPPPPCPLPGVTLTALTLADGLVAVAGRAEPGLRLTLDLAGRQDAASPGPDGSFRLALPQAAEPARLAVTGPQAAAMELPPFPPARLRIGRLMLVPGFAVALARALPAALRWWRQRDPADRRRIKRILGLAAAGPAPRLDPAWLPGAGAAVGAGAPPDPESTPEITPEITIVLPVYNARALLEEALSRLIAHTDLPWHLILVEDGSSDPAIRPFLRGWVAGLASTPTRAPARVTLIENPANLGFIAAVNRGFAAALADGGAGGVGGPVILLNSDALVPAGWAGRLVAPLRADPSVASVTPMSNDAELMSVPAICARGDLFPGEGDAVDRLAENLPRGEGLAGSGGIVLPTGVGFCMAIARPWLARFPAFDTAFGRGYGEEVDWCLTAAAAGARHLGLPGLFVEHRGGASFGSAEKQALLLKNGAIISARHPGFDTGVQATIAADPMATARMALGLALAAARATQPETGQGGYVPVWLGHSLGGGADHDLSDRIAATLARGGMAVVLRVGGEIRWRIELHAPSGVHVLETPETAAMERLLAILPRRHVIYSCGAGDPDMIELPEVLLRLGRGARTGRGEDHRIGMLFHDYLPLSPAYTLLDADGQWRGLPAADSADAAHRARRPDGRRATLADWRAAWHRLAAAAGTLTVFSGASRDIVAAAWPDLAARIAVRPHALRFPVGKIVPGAGLGAGQGGRPVIGVLGNIGAHKGAGVVAALGRLFAQDGAARLVVIGNVDPAFRLPRGVHVQGDYRLDDLPRLVARHGITCWLIPSVWPETFSFTTHEALATGLPVVAFALGAQGEAVARAVAAGAPGAVVPLSGDARAAAAALVPVLLAQGTGVRGGRA